MKNMIQECVSEKKVARIRNECEEVLCCVSILKFDLNEKDFISTQEPQNNVPNPRPILPYFVWT